jgi:hypothetical protein
VKNKHVTAHAGNNAITMLYQVNDGPCDRRSAAFLIPRNFLAKFSGFDGLLPVFVAWIMK